MSSISAVMEAAAREWLSSLTAEQRKLAVLPFEGDERFNWHFTPRMRRGLPFKEMDAAQRMLAHALIATGVSARGYRKAVTIMSLEPVLRELEGGRGYLRDSDLYFVSVFGTPSPVSTWGWRVEGHHVSLNLTVVDGREVTGAPSFFGANPAEVRQGPRAGLRVLATEEDLGRQLITSLDEKRRARAIIDAVAPADILSYNRPRIEPEPPRGVPVTAFTMPQVDLLMALLDEFIAVMPEEIAAERTSAVRRTHWEDLHFAWAGGIDPGAKHYYRIQAPTFLVEYDNTQNEANHIHTVWRDYAGDFGRDLLGEHYQVDHTPEPAEVSAD